MFSPLEKLNFNVENFRNKGQVVREESFGLAHLFNQSNHSPYVIYQLKLDTAAHKRKKS